MTSAETREDRFTSLLAAEDYIDLVNAASRRSPRMRTMLWAMVSPDGLMRSAFGRRSYVQDAAVKAELAAVRAGFVTFEEIREPRDEGRTRIERRWRAEFRVGVAALTDWVAVPDGAALDLMCSLNKSAREPVAASLFTSLSAEPSKVKLLPACPGPVRVGESVELDEWLVSSAELLECIERTAG
jgi:hypothetical protein